MNTRNMSESAKRELHTTTAQRYAEKALHFVNVGCVVYAYAHARIAAHKGYLAIGRGQGRANQPIPILD